MVPYIFQWMLPLINAPPFTFLCKNMPKCSTKLFWCMGIWCIFSSRGGGRRYTEILYIHSLGQIFGVQNIEFWYWGWGGGGSEKWIGLFFYKEFVDIFLCKGRHFWTGGGGSLFFKWRCRMGIFLWGGRAKISVFLGYAWYTWYYFWVNSRCWGQAYAARKIESQCLLGFSHILS